MTQSKAELGRFIRQVRLNRGLTQAQLSLYTGIGQAEISRIENGERKTPSPEYLRKIGEVLHIPPRQLMVLAGYIKEDEPETLTPWERLENALVQLDVFTMDEVDDILEYIRFRAHRKKVVEEKKAELQKKLKQIEEEKKKELENELNND